MKSNKRTRFVLCNDNKHYAASLEFGKVYQTLYTEKSAREQGQIRVIDESGEDYLYSAERFVTVGLPRAGK